MGELKVQLSESDMNTIVERTAAAVVGRIKEVVGGLKLKAAKEAGEEVWDIGDAIAAFPKLTNYKVRQMCVTPEGALHKKHWTEGTGQTAKKVFLRKDLEDAYYGRKEGKEENGRR